MSRSLSLMKSVRFEHNSSRMFCITALGEGQANIYYIGLKDVTGNNRDYRWTRDGANLTFSNWASNEPNAVSELCVAAFARASRFGQWADINCGRSEYAMCEADMVS